MLLETIALFYKLQKKTVKYVIIDDGSMRDKVVQ
jgi:hypothetical protein